MIYATINAQAALIPIALFAPRFGKKVATNTATRAKHTGGINDLYPYLSAFSRVVFSFSICPFATVSLSCKPFTASSGY